MTYKPVGVDENSDFPPRVEQRLLDKFVTMGDLSSVSFYSVDAPAEGTYFSGTNWLGYPYVTSTNLGSSVYTAVTTDPRVSTFVNTVVESNPRVFSVVDAKAAGVYVSGTNWAGKPLDGVTSDVMRKEIYQSTYGHQRDLIRAKARRIHYRKRDKAQIAIVCDDYPKDTLDIFIPMVKARGIPISWALNANTFDPGYSYLPFSVGKSWADIASLDPKMVEVVNHGATHADVSSVDALEYEIVDSRLRLRAYTGQNVFGWIPPGCNYPEDIRYKTGPLITDEEVYAKSQFSRLVLENHAWATGFQRSPQDGGLVTHVMTEFKSDYLGRQWLEQALNGGVKGGGIGDTHVNAAISRKHGVILSLHAYKIEGGMASEPTMSRVELEGFLDRLVALRDAGQVDLVTLSDWYNTIIT